MEKTWLNCTNSIWSYLKIERHSQERNQLDKYSLFLQKLTKNRKQFWIQIQKKGIQFMRKLMKRLLFVIIHKGILIQEILKRNNRQTVLWNHHQEKQLYRKDQYYSSQILRDLLFKNILLIWIKVIAAEILLPNLLEVQVNKMEFRRRK